MNEASRERSSWNTQLLVQSLSDGLVLPQHRYGKAARLRVVTCPSDLVSLVAEE